ncbi:MAG: hypothetical protein Q4B26_16570 [Eubacteriales bacterium]|nr:hypothetical protein [Eubacteriales bacterium]
MKGFRCVNDIICTADALISLNRMYEHEGFNEDSKYLYAICRDIPVFFFPRENGGINTSRYAIFGDRIDHTLYDLKRYCDGANDCKMMETYNRPKTKEWLSYFERDFEKIVGWLGIDGLFVEMIEGEYKIYDLEKGYGFVESYLETYPKQWSSEYYSNILDKMKQIIQKCG